MSTPSNILIWHQNIGFIQILEGSGDSLLPEDEEEGYVDYMLVDGYDFNGYELVECYDCVEGSQVMLRELYQDMFQSAEDVVKYLINEDWIPDEEYIILYAM